MWRIDRIILDGNALRNGCQARMWFKGPASACGRLHHLHGLLRAPIEQVVGLVRAGYGKTMGDEAGGIDLGEHPPGHLPATSLAPASRKAEGDGAELA